MSRKWYAVCSKHTSYEEGDQERDTAKIWTVSTSPKEPGWETDLGTPGYGLTKADAEFLASAANQAQSNKEPLPDERRLINGRWHAWCGEGWIAECYSANVLWPVEKRA